jgi:hypothetical protein
MEGEEHDNHDRNKKNFPKIISYFKLVIGVRGVLHSSRYTGQPTKNEKNQHLTTYAQRNGKNSEEIK